MCSSPCISIYSCKENQLDALLILSIFRQSTSTCFGRIYRPLSGGTQYIYNWYFFCFDVMLTVHLSIFISVINKLDAQNFCFTISSFHASTCFEHMCSKHVEAWNKLIVKQNFCASSWLITEIKSKLHYTASGIITPIGVMIPEAVQCNFDLLMMKTCLRNM